MINHYEQTTKKNYGNISYTIPVLISSWHLEAPAASRPVSKHFRMRFLEMFGLNHISAPSSSDIELLRLAAILLPGGHRDIGEEDEAEILLSHSFVCSVVRPGRKGKDLSVLRLLSRFQKKFWKLEIEPSNRFTGKATKVTDQKLPLALRTLLDEELRCWPIPDAVDLVTGESWKGAHPELAPSQVPEVEAIRQDLNSLAPCLFECVIEGAPETLLWIVGRKDLSIEQKRHQCALLQRIGLSPMPLYKAVSGTTRLYCEGASWLGLRKEIRSRLTSTYWKFDLSAAQLRIGSSLWGFKLLTDPEDGSVWTYLLRVCGHRKHNDVEKAKIKKFVYRALFGSTRSNLKREAMRLGLSPLLSDPLIMDLLEKRDAAAETLRAGNQVLDAWGNTLQVTATSSLEQTRQTRSIMAAVCQSYELKILLPVFEYAKANDLTVTALLHDGIYATGDWFPNVQIVQDLVSDESKRLLGIVVPLEAIPPSD